MTSATEQAVFRAIADPARRGILDRLARQGATAALELGRDFHGSQPALSKHLRVLRTAGLVRVRRDGRQQLYTIRPQPLASIERWISLYRRFWEGRLDALARHLDKRP
ncbi:MAG: metalloregulator ArsR/SmtB family transcription factor [Planctomycetota bacterium]